MATNSETKIHLLLLLMVMVPSWGFQLRVMRLESIYRRGPNSCSPGHFTVSICTSEVFDKCEFLRVNFDQDLCSNSFVAG